MKTHVLSLGLLLALSAAPALAAVKAEIGPDGSMKFVNVDGVKHACTVKAPSSPEFVAAHCQFLDKTVTFHMADGSKTTQPLAQAVIFWNGTSALTDGDDQWSFRMPGQGSGW